MNFTIFFLGCSTYSMGKIFILATFSTQIPIGPIVTLLGVRAKAPLIHSPLDYKKLHSAYKVSFVFMTDYFIFDYLRSDCRFSISSSSSSDKRAKELGLSSNSYSTSRSFSPQDGWPNVTRVFLRPAMSLGSDYCSSIFITISSECSGFCVFGGS